jgi:hypothetical protein
LKVNKLKNPKEGINNLKTAVTIIFDLKNSISWP